VKLIIQIPCFDEESSLPGTLAALPREVAGFDKVEWLVIDDGSKDRTALVARENGVDHVVDLRVNRGLATAFVSGIYRCLQEGADVIVNIDADNQYCAEDIPELTRPILDGKADYVIGERPIDEIGHFPRSKKALQKIGSYVVRRVSGVAVQDAPSGFRALSRACASRMNVFNSYTYTLETIIQAGQSNMIVLSVPVRVNADLRPSKLVRSSLDYVKRSIVTIVRIFVIYRSFRFFVSIGILLFLIGVVLGVRFLYFFFSGEGDGHVQSVILSGIFLGFGFQTILAAFVADLISVNRRMLEDLRATGRERKD